MQIKDDKGGNITIIKGCWNKPYWVCISVKEVIKEPCNKCGNGDIRVSHILLTKEKWESLKEYIRTGKETSGNELNKKTKPRYEDSWEQWKSTHQKMKTVKERK